MPGISRRRGGASTSFDWSGLSWLPMFTPTIRIEEFQEEGRYVIRAELPGVDPEKDIEITCTEGELRLRVERAEEQRDKVRSEFQYGSLFRAVPLPPAARQDAITARYSDGILTIDIPMRVERPEKAIPVEINKRQ
ncbi:MAG TPA: Hsp20/alpha crystallin family protein [Micromonosporaceae bacterium]